MSSDIVYMSAGLNNLIKKVACERFNIEAASIALILLQNHKTTFEKKGIEVASDVMSFVLFDQALNKIGVIKRSQLTNQATEVSQ